MLCTGRDPTLLPCLSVALSVFCAQNSSGVLFVNQPRVIPSGGDPPRRRTAGVSGPPETDFILASFPPLPDGPRCPRWLDRLSFPTARLSGLSMLLHPRRPLPLTALPGLVGRGRDKDEDELNRHSKD